MISTCRYHADVNFVAFGYLKAAGPFNHNLFTKLLFVFTHLVLCGEAWNTGIQSN